MFDVNAGRSAAPDFRKSPHLLQRQLVDPGRVPSVSASYQIRNARSHSWKRCPLVHTRLGNEQRPAVPEHAHPTAGRFDSQRLECSVRVESVLADFSKAVAERDWNRAGVLLADGFFDYQPKEGEPSAGERILPLLTDLGRALPDLEIRFEDVNADGSLSRALLSMAGTHQNPLWGSPGTGRSVAWTNPVTVRVTDGTFAVRFDDVALPELIGLLRQFGLVNPPDRMDEPLPYPVSVPEFLLKVIITGQAGDKDCDHLDRIRVTQPETRVCAPCYAEGVNWPALRMCLTCGSVGCCDTSKRKHALKHHEETGHPMMRSIRLDESWVWCYEDNAFFEGTILSRYPSDS